MEVTLTVEKNPHLIFSKGSESEMSELHTSRRQKIQIYMHESLFLHSSKEDCFRLGYS